MERSTLCGVLYCSGPPINRRPRALAFSSLPPMTLFQCCEDSCVSGSYYECGSYEFYCLDPAFFDPELVAEYPDCTGDVLLIGDGECDSANNMDSCGYDGGDCCSCSCTDVSCLWTAFDCLDPSAHEDVYECKAKPPAALPCSSGVQQAWIVETSEQARALAAAVNCSGGSFEVEWRGRVVVDETIYVAGGTVLTINGAGTDAVIDGNTATRLFAVVGAALHVNDVNITSGASRAAGGAIAAAGSALTFNRTSFIGNSATWHGGAVFASAGSHVSCIGGGAFANNWSGGHGGAMFVTGSSAISSSSSWVNNTAGGEGGALTVYNSSTSWGDGETFAFNTAVWYGGAFAASRGARVSWSGATSFVSNSVEEKGGAISVDGSGGESTVSWSGVTTFSYNMAGSFGGAVNVMDVATVSWSGRTKFVANAAYEGGAIFASNASSVSWTGATEFMSNIAGADGGVVGSTGNPLDSVLMINATTTFSNNSCGASGGALALRGGLSLEIGNVEVSFVNNTAALSGGAVFLSGTELGPVFPGVLFKSNSAQVGGAVSSLASGNSESHSRGPTTFERCHFIGNVAEAMGGAIKSAAGQDLISEGVFEGNRAGTGGALRLAGTAYLANCSFVENVSYNDEGAAVSNIGTLFRVENTSFGGNTFSCPLGMFLGSNEVTLGVCAYGEPSS